MPKHIIEFNLPEEKDDLILAQKGRDYWLVLWNLIHGQEGVRGKLKYGHNFKDADEVLEWVRDTIYEQIDIDEIE